MTSLSFNKLFQVARINELQWLYPITDFVSSGIKFRVLDKFGYFTAV